MIEKWIHLRGISISRVDFERFFAGSLSDRLKILKPHLFWWFFCESSEESIWIT